MAKKFTLENNPLENNPLFNAPAADQTQEAPAQPVKRGRGRPKKDDVVRGVSAQEGLTEAYARATFIVRVDLTEKLKNLAYTERLTVKDVLNRILEEGIAQEEKRLEKQGGQLLDRKGGNE